MKNSVKNSISRNGHITINNLKSIYNFVDGSFDMSLRVLKNKNRKWIIESITGLNGLLRCHSIRPRDFDKPKEYASIDIMLKDISRVRGSSSRPIIIDLIIYYDGEANE